jgi:hypothetical protein
MVNAVPEYFVSAGYAGLCQHPTVLKLILQAVSDFKNSKR